jgi:two-component system LytT family response regulator
MSIELSGPLRPIEGSAPASPRELLSARERGRIRVIPLEEVEWIEAAHNHVRLHTADQVIRRRDSIGRLEAELANLGFVRVHRGALVRANRIRAVLTEATGRRLIELASGARVTLGRKYLDAVRQRLA